MRRAGYLPPPTKYLTTPAKSVTAERTARHAWHVEAQPAWYNSLSKEKRKVQGRCKELGMRLRTQSGNGYGPRRVPAFCEARWHLVASTLKRMFKCIVYNGIYTCNSIVVELVNRMIWLQVLNERVDELDLCRLLDGRQMRHCVLTKTHWMWIP